MEAGLPKERIAFLAIPVVPLQIILPWIIRCLGGGVIRCRGNKGGSIVWDSNNQDEGKFGALVVYITSTANLMGVCVTVVFTVACVFYIFYCNCNMDVGCPV